MWDSPSVVAGEEGRSSPVPNDLRGRRPHHSGAGLLRPVIPATCATVSLGWYTAAPVASDGESDSSNPAVCRPLCRLPPRPTRVVLPIRRKPSLLEAGGSASKDGEIAFTVASASLSAESSAIVPDTDPDRSAGGCIFVLPPTVELSLSESRLDKALQPAIPATNPTVAKRMKPRREHRSIIRRYERNDVIDLLLRVHAEESHHGISASSDAFEVPTRTRREPATHRGNSRLSPS